MVGSDNRHSGVIGSTGSAFCRIYPRAHVGTNPSLCLPHSSSAIGSALFVSRCRAIVIGLMLLADMAHGADSVCNIVQFGELPLTMVGGRALVNATINGSDAKLIVDSGAFFSSLTNESAQRFKLRLGPLPFGFTISGIGGRADAQLTHVANFTLTGLKGPPIKNVDFVVLGNRLAGEADGLIGENILGFVDTEYDLGHNVIRLMRAKDCDTATLTYWHGESDFAEMEIAHRTAKEPHIIGHATLNGVSIRVLFDSGAPKSTLTLRAAARAGVTPSSVGVTAAGESRGVGSKVIETWVGKFANLNLGGEEIRNIGLLFGINEIDDGADMLLGLDFFQSHRIYVAKAQSKVYFTYNGGKVFDLSATHDADANAIALTDKPTVSDKLAGAATTSDGAGVSAEPLDAPGYNRRAAGFASRRQFDLALADYVRAIELQPEDPANFHDRGIADLQNKQPVLAMSDFDHALQLKPDHLPSLLARGRLRLANKDLQGAAVDFDAIRKVAPTNQNLILEIAQAYENQHEYATAIVDFDHWIAENSRDERLPDVLGQRCWSRAALGVDLSLALADCNKAIRRGGDSVEARNARAVVQIKMGNFDKAIVDFDEAINRQPKDARAYYGRGLAEARKRLSSRSQVDLKTAVDMDAEVAAHYKNIGLSL